MYSIGADPELFLINDKKKVISAIGLIGGTKHEPKKVKELDVLKITPENERLLGKTHGDFAVQEDNVTLEYNIPTATQGEIFLRYNTGILNHIDKLLRPLGLQRHVVPSVVMDDDQLENPLAWIFGCEPDFDAWSLKVNPNPQSPNPKLRSAGGHIHIGYDKPNKIKSIDITRWMDAYVGLPLSLAEPENERSQLYGKPGAMRFKPYGLEYRVPSNYWTSSADRMRWVFSQTIAACQAAEASGPAPKDLKDLFLQGTKKDKKNFLNHFGITPCP